MKVLVTGGAGFIGSHTVEKFIEEKCIVHVLDNLSGGFREYLPDDMRLINMDIRNMELRNLFKAEKYDAVVHLAAQVSAPLSINDPYEDADINILGLINVLEACRLNNVGRIVYASSAAVYGDNDNLPLKESEQTSPMSFYGLSKLTMEKYLYLYNKLYGLSYNILRYSNVYGERQGNAGEGGVISVFLQKIKKEQPIVIHGNGEQTRDFIYVKDVANANYFAATVAKENSNNIFNVSTNDNISINALTRMINLKSGRDFDIMFADVRKGDILHSVLDNEKINKVLGWQIKYNISEGIKKTVRYFLDDR